MGRQQISVFAEKCLFSSSIAEKLGATFQAYGLWRAGRLGFVFERQPKPISQTCFPDYPKLVEPRDLRRRSMNTEAGRIALLHAIAHIEFYAIHLAWDIIYRFQDMPQLFYQDWLAVAQEEAKHFSMIRRRLQRLDSDYGNLPAHRGLWEVAEDTQHDVLARLALVPRYMEARGLDVTPAMIAKLQSVGDEDNARVLTKILNGELGHVQVGSRWFNAVCRERNQNPEEAFFTLIARHLRGKIRGPINHALRKRAGFTDSEIQRLEELKC